MIRRLLIPLLASALLLTVTAGAAFAKCEGPNPPAFCQQTVASMDFGSAGSSIRAGAQTPVRLWVIRGEQPADEITVTPSSSRIGGTAVVRARPSPPASRDSGARISRCRPAVRGQSSPS